MITSWYGTEFWQKMLAKRERFVSLNRRCYLIDGRQISMEGAAPSHLEGLGSFFFLGKALVSYEVDKKDF
jgi:hypothetical protein